MNSHEVFIHIHQGCFAGTGAIVRLPQCQWSKPGGYGKISQCITTAKHSKAKTVCIFLGVYCSTLEEKDGIHSGMLNLITSSLGNYQRNLHTWCQDLETISTLIALCQVGAWGIGVCVCNPPVSSQYLDLSDHLASLDASLVSTCVGGNLIWHARMDLRIVG